MKCLYCLKEFKPKSSRQVHCTKRCEAARHSKMAIQRKGMIRKLAKDIALGFLHYSRFLMIEPTASDRKVFEKAYRRWVL